MKKTRNTVCLIIFSVFLLLALIISMAYNVFIFMVTITEDKIDKDFAYYTASGEVVTKRYDIPKESEYFSIFDEMDYDTRFANAIPSVKVVNDEQYYVELTTNSPLFDVLSIGPKYNNGFYIDCKEEYYNEDYYFGTYYGLYVDCTQLDIVIHAPVSHLEIGTDAVVDCQLAPAEKVSIDLEYATGKIYGIDAKDFSFSVAGRSRLTVSGNVAGETTAFIAHDSRIDARELHTEKYDIDLTRGVYGFSYLKTNKVFRPFVCDLIGGPTNNLSLIFNAPLIVFVNLLALCIILRFVPKKHDRKNEESFTEEEVKEPLE